MSLRSAAPTACPVWRTLLRITGLRMRRASRRKSQNVLLKFMKTIAGECIKCFNFFCVYMYFSHLGITFAVTIFDNLILLQFSWFSTSSCFRLLDPNAQNQYDVFLMSYANILYHWGYTNNSKLVLKFMTHLPEPHTGIGMITKACLLCLSLFYMKLSLVWRL